jgi:hypothetical protein
MDYLKEFIIEEYEKGNYVIVGGDWNRNTPDVDYSETKENSPTKRYLNAPYEKGKTISPIIDFYLMSPNIKCQFVKTIDFYFLNTDNQPTIHIFNLE